MPQKAQEMQQARMEFICETLLQGNLSKQNIVTVLCQVEGIYIHSLMAPKEEEVSKEAGFGSVEDGVFVLSEKQSRRIFDSVLSGWRQHKLDLQS